jgi:hypothetical protein
VQVHRIPLQLEVLEMEEVVHLLVVLVMLAALHLLEIY